MYKKQKMVKNILCLETIVDDITIKLQRDVITIEAIPTVDLAELTANQFFEI